MATFSVLDLSRLSLSSSFEPKVVHRDTDLIRRFETFTATGRSWNYSLNFSTSYHLTPLTNISSEYQEVVLRVRQSIPVVFRSDYKVTAVQRIENAYLWEQFCLKRAFKMESRPSTRVMKLFHGTRAAHLDSICQHNLDWRKVGSTRYLGNKYGTGVSFSPDFKYASQFPRGGESCIRTMLLCDVLVDQMHHGNPFHCIPLEGYDATVSPNGKVIVKYDDNEFYPNYIINYY